MLRLFGATVLALCALSAGARAADFKLGVVMPMSGGGAETGKENVASAKAAVSLVNARGGIGGMKVQMTVCDSQSMEQQAVLCARQLLSDKSNVIIGAASTPQTLAIVPAVDAVGVPLFSIAGGTGVYRPVRKWVFKAIQSNEDAMAVNVDYLKRKGLTKVAVIRDNGPFGADVAQNLKTYAGRAGLEVVADEVYAPTDTDMTAQVTRIRALRPQAIIAYSLTHPVGATIIKKISQLGITAPIFVSGNLHSLAFVKLVADAAEQVNFVGQKAAMSVIPEGDPLRENIMAFREHFGQANPGQELTSLAPNVADPLLLTQEAGKSLGARSLEPAALLAELERLQDVRGVQGIWTLSASSHESPLHDGAAVMKHANGTWQPAQ